MIGVHIFGTHVAMPCCSMFQILNRRLNRVGSTLYNRKTSSFLWLISVRVYWAHPVAKGEQGTMSADHPGSVSSVVSKTKFENLLRFKNHADIWSCTLVKRDPISKSGYRLQLYLGMTK